MIKHTLTLSLLAAAFAASPASAGQAERAVALCKAKAVQQSGTADVRVRSINPSAKQTRVQIIVDDANQRRFDCRVDYRGEIMLAEFDRPSAAQSAAR